MTITKTALVTGAITGAIRSGDLSLEDRKLLRKYYGMVEDENIKSKGISRAALMDFGGSTVGGFLGARIGGGKGAGLGWLAGKALGSGYGSDKYSKRNVRRIREELGPEGVKKLLEGS